MGLAAVITIPELFGTRSFTKLKVAQGKVPPIARSESPLNAGSLRKL